MVINRISKIFSSFFVIACFLVACNNDEILGIKDSTCIGTFNEFAFHQEKWNTSIDDVKPTDPWKFQVELPEENDSTSASSVSLTRNINDMIEIWIERKVRIGESHDNFLKEFFIYKPKTNEITIVSSKIGDEEVWVEELFVTKDGNIWGNIVWNPRTTYSFSEMPTLSRFDDISMEFIVDTQSPKIPLQLGEDFDSDQVEIILGENDEFWVFISNTGLFRYDPLNNNISQVLDLPNFKITELALAPDGSLYFIKKDNKLGLQNEEVFKFMPSTGELIALKAPSEPWPMIWSILIDREERLWLGAVGWRDQDGNWNLMYPNPEDYFKYVTGYPSLIPPKIIFESSNGFLWFSTFSYENRGVAWFDPSEGVGCWFTTEFTNVVEDSERVMWIVVDGGLFRLDLYP